MSAKLPAVRAGPPTSTGSKPTAAAPKPPRKPTGSPPPSKPGTTAGGARASIAPGSPKNKASVAAAVLSLTGHTQRDEAAQRDLIETDEKTSHQYLLALSHSEALTAVQTRSRTTHANVNQIIVQLDDHTKHNFELDDRLLSLNQEVTATKQQLVSLTERLSSTERQRLQQLELEANYLRRTLDNTTLELERVRAENAALRDTLSRKISKTTAEHEALRDEVRDEIKRSALLWDNLRQSLYARVDETVLHYHRPQFESSLASLKETAATVKAQVDAHSDRLRLTIDCIGASDEVMRAMTMHSNLSGLYRRELSKYTKEQLLLLIDALSFEDGVAAAVGRSIFATDHNRTQSVFA